MNGQEWCWVDADGHLESGSEADLLRAYTSGRIPSENPVWCPTAQSWLTLRDAMPAEDDAATLRRTAVSAAQADELVPSTRREQPWFQVEPAPVERLGVAPTPVVDALQFPPPPGSVRPTVRTVPPTTRSLAPLLIGAGFAAAGVMVAALLVASAVVSRAPALAARELGRELGPSPKKAAQAPGCRTTIAPRRAAALVVPGSPLSVATFGSKIAVGAVAAQRSGLGLMLSAEDLSVEKTEWIADPIHVAAVVPASDDAFIVDRWTRSMPGTNAFSVGMTPLGFSRVGRNGADQSAIWPGGARDPITRPAVAHAPARGYAIAFRHGDGAGSIKLGFIDETGAPKGELESYAADAEAASAPALAIGDGRLALAFAERAIGGSWRIRAGQSAVGSAPRELRSFGSRAQAPAIGALAGGHWLLAWVESGSDGAAIRAQMLDAQLAPVGPIVDVADADGTTPSLAIWSSPTRSVVVFTKDAGNLRGELWAAGLECR